MTSREENDNVHNLVRGSGGNIWIGYRYEPTKDTFVWVSSAKEGSYTNWQGNSPFPQSAASQPCVQIVVNSPGAGWRNSVCTEQLAFVCETGKGKI